MYKIVVQDYFSLHRLVFKKHIDSIARILELFNILINGNNKVSQEAY